MTILALDKKVRALFSARVRPALKAPAIGPPRITPYAPLDYAEHAGEYRLAVDYFPFLPKDMLLQGIMLQVVVETIREVEA